MHKLLELLSKTPQVLSFALFFARMGAAVCNVYGDPGTAHILTAVADLISPALDAATHGIAAPPPVPLPVRLAWRMRERRRHQH